MDFLSFVVLVLSYYSLFFSYRVSCSSVERSSISRAPPWQQDSSAKREASPFIEELPPNVFAPHGRLYQVEDAVHAVSSGSDTSSTSLIAIQCKDGIAVVTTLPQSPYFKCSEDRNEDVALGASLCLLDHDSDCSKEDYTSVPPFSRLQCPRTSPATNDDILSQPSTLRVVVTAGNAVESQLLRHRLHQTAQRLRRSPATSELDPSDWTACLARTLADQQQQRTQLLSGGRLVAATAVLLEPNHLYRIDPAGTLYMCQAVVAGRHAKRIEQCLLDRLLRPGETTSMRRREICALLSQRTMDEAISMATECLLEGLRSDRSSGKVPWIRLRAVAIMSSNASAGGGVLRCYSSQELLTMVHPASVV